MDFEHAPRLKLFSLVGSSDIVYLYIHTYIHTYAYKHSNRDACMYVCMHVCMYALWVYIICVEYNRLSGTLVLLGITGLEYHT